MTLDNDCGLGAVLGQSLPLVSVVTPAYNEEKYLAECVESVLAQTYSNWEYIIVDNCSADSTLAVARTFAERDPRIRVVQSSEHVSAIANINRSLRQISPASEYCKMVLADDWLFPECLQRMVVLMEKHPSMGVVGAYGLSETSVVWAGLPYSIECVEGREICRARLLGGPYVFGSPTSVLFRSDVVRARDPFYDDANPSADSEACFAVLKDFDFGFAHQILTFSRARPGSQFDKSKSLNTEAHALLRQLVVYGPIFLSSEEYAKRFQTLIAKYYSFLASSLLQRRSREFWEYHRAKLIEEGVGFSWVKLALAFLDRGIGRLTAVVRPPEIKRNWGLE